MPFADRGRRASIRRLGSPLLLIGIFATCQLDPGKQPDTFSFPSLADSLRAYDSVYILLKDSHGEILDTLFSDPVASAADLQKLEAPHYHGGKTIITILGFMDGTAVYESDRAYDPRKQEVDSISVRATPFATVRLGARALEIPVRTLSAFPSLAIEPERLSSKKVKWFSSQEKIVRIEADGLRAVSVGIASVYVSLESDSAKRDTLSITVTARPALPDSIRIHPDTLILAASGRPFPFSIAAYPPGASRAVSWSLSDSTLAGIAADGAVQGRYSGILTAIAVSLEDAELRDTAIIRVLAPAPVESIRFIQDSIEIFEGGSAGNLEYQVSPALASTDIVYRLDDSSIASIRNHQAEGLKAGTTRIWGESREAPSKRDSLMVIVLSRQNVDSIVASRDSVRLYLGGPPVPLSAGVFPSTAAQRVQWMSLNEKLVRIDAAGIATAIGEGKTALIAKSLADSSKQDRILAEVRKDTPLLTLGRGDTTVGFGATVAFRPAAPQEYGKVTRFEWDLDGDGAWDGSADSLRELSYKYPAAGNFLARFRVSDTEGNDTTVTKRIRIVTGPVIMIESPPDSFQTNQRNLEVVWSIDGSKQTAETKETLLQYGRNTIVRSARDSAGNVHSDSITVILDTLAPGKPKLAGATPVNTRTPAWAWTSGGLGGNGTYRYRLDDEDMSGAKLLQDTVYVPPTDLGAGTHTLFVQERDDAGNWSPSGRYAIVIDVIPPPQPMAAAGMPGLTNNPKPKWKWTSGAGDGMGLFRFRLDNADQLPSATPTNADSFTPSSELGEGEHILHVQERDSAGNWSNPAALAIRIDLTAPKAPVFDSTPYSPLNTLRPTWTWKGGGGGMGIFRCRIDEANLAEGSDTVKQPSFKPGFDLSQGSRVLYIQERDSSGNWSPPSQRALFLSLRENLGMAGFSQGEVSIHNASLQFGAPDGPIVVYAESDNRPAVAEQFNSGTWKSMGNLSAFGNFRWTKSFRTSPSGVPYVVLQDSASKGTVLRYVLGRWEKVGPSDFAEGSIGEAAIAFSESGTPYVAYRDDSLGRSSVRTFNGIEWELVGPRGFSSGFTIFHNLIITHSGSLFLACIGDSLESNSISIRKFNTASNLWERYTEFPARSYASTPFHLAVSEMDTLFLSLFSKETMAVEVYRLDGATWTRVGAPVSPYQLNWDIGFSIDRSGRLFVSYWDESNSGRITLKTFKGGTWVPVGPVGFTSIADRTMLSSFTAVDSNGIPHVMFSEGSKGKRLTITKTSFDP